MSILLPESLTQANALPSFDPFDLFERVNGLLKTHHWQDQFGRIKTKLRISVTDRCNFRCVYCMPSTPEWFSKSTLLHFDELYLFCLIMVLGGVDSIRITGGEPLMRVGVVELIVRLQSLRSYGLKRLSMTTNAHYLAEYAQVLKQAGLDDVNISLDALDEEIFEQLTQRTLQPVLEGIDAAIAVNLPVKINCVLMRRYNIDQILPLTAWAIQRQLPLRFIEFMPLDGEQRWQHDDVVSEAEILTILQSHYTVELMKQGHDPARTYWLNGHFPVGIISTITHPFCQDCNRIRLSAQGELFNCLFSGQGVQLRPLLRKLVATKSDENRQQWHQDLDTLVQSMADHIWYKRAGFDQQHREQRIAMYNVGG